MTNEKIFRVRYLCCFQCRGKMRELWIDSENNVEGALDKISSSPAFNGGTIYILKRQEIFNIRIGTRIYKEKTHTK